MSTFKRCISLLLVLVMVVSMIPAQAAAAGYRTVLEKSSELDDILEQLMEGEVLVSGQTAPETAAQPEAIPEPEIILMDTEGNYSYTVSAENTATITEYTGSDTELVIPDTLGGYPVTGIGENAFSNQVALRSIVFPAALVTLGGCAFTGCSSLTEIVIPKSLQTANLAAHSYCGPFYNSGIRKAVLEDGMTAVPANLFWGATQLEEIVIPDSVTSIGSDAFHSCSALSAIKLPSSLTVLEGKVFTDCSSLTEIAIPKSLQTANLASYSYCGPFYNSGIRKAVLEDGMTAVPANLFWDATQLEEIVIPDSVTSIGSDAFHSCSALSAIKLPSSLTVLEGKVFTDCSSLTEIAIPKSLQTANLASYSYCGPFYNSGIRKAVLEDGMTAVPANLFWDATQLEEIVIPDSVTSIGSDAFHSCSALSAIKLPSSLTVLEGKVFTDCSSLTEIAIPKSLQTANLASYSYCGPFYNSGIRKAVLEDGMTAVPANLFWDATQLETIVLPDSVTTIESNAFANCTNAIMYCRMDSCAVECAIMNNFLVHITDWTRPESDIVDMGASYYNTNTTGTTASGYVDLVMHYELKPEQLATLSDMKLKILLQSKLVLVENSLRLDGEVPQGYSYKDNVLTVPVTKESGTLRFAVNPESAAVLFTRAELTYRKDGTNGSAIIDCINSDMPVLTMVVPQTLNTESFLVSGIAPAEAALTFFIDGVDSGTAIASKAGNYSAELRLPDVQEGKSYIVRAVATVGETVVEKSMKVTYDLATPVLEELLLYYSGHETGRYENYIVDLTDPHASRTVITFNPTHDYIFRVKMSNPEQISCLYVTSTRNGQTKYIEAKYDEKTGYFVTKDKFDNDVWNYVPGEIGVIYDRTYPELDRSDLEGTADALIEDTAEHADLSQIEVSVAENTQEDYVVNAVMPDGKEVTYEYHMFTRDELISYLLDEGVISDQDINMVRPQGFDFEDLLLELFEYRVLNDEEYYTTSNSNGTFYLSPIDDPSSEEDVFAIWGMKGSLTWVLDMMLDSDNAELLGNGMGSMYLDGFEAIYRYGDRMWHLNMDKKTATPEQLAQIEETEELLNFVLMSRLILAAAQFSITALCPPAGLAVAVVSFFLSDLLDSLEEEGSWVEGYENSIIGSIMNWHSLLQEAMVLFVVQNLLKWIIDPSGYVYEAVTTNRLSGVTATVYFQNPETGQAVLWDAGEYDQINPIITGPDGGYAWDVPEGMWQVKYELEGYETVYSEWLPVPPPQTDVNVGLVSYAAPDAQWIDVYHDSVEIAFSKYMIPETVDDIVLTDADGNVIAYDLEYSTDETAADGTVYARNYTMNFDSAILERGEVCVISIPESVRSYAGVAVKPMQSELVCTEQILILAPETVTVPYGQQLVIPVSISVEGFDTIEVVSMFAELAAVDNIARTNDGWDITVSGNLPGRTAILVTIPGTNVSKYVELFVDASDGAHAHDYTVEVFDATCTASGEKVYTCTICGEFRVETVPALGHAWGDWIVIQEPTTTENGVEEHICTRCGHAEQRSIAKLENPFNDVAPGSFYYEPVMWAIENGITNGTSATTFGPNDQCMRAHVVTFLWRAVGSPEPTRTDNPFVDVKPTDFYYKPVLWAVENGITSGMDSTHFGPTAYCNRAQVVTFLYRTMGSPDVGAATNPFTDVAAGSFYEKPVLWAVENGVTAGLSATSFGPNSICNRAQIVTFLYRAFVD